jgi:enamine deaminase RidA (YjgF/YER057c/UK114 family)
LRQNIASQSPYEPLIGFSRAVRVGNTVWVSGTAPWDENGKIVQGDVYLQTRACIENIAAALEKAGATLQDVVRTRIYVVDIDRWEDVARAHREAFAAIMPASTLVQVSALASPDMLVELEAEAVIAGQ